jgi:hypothetical protein
MFLSHEASCDRALILRASKFISVGLHLRNPKKILRCAIKAEGKLWSSQNILIAGLSNS